MNVHIQRSLLLGGLLFAMRNTWHSTGGSFPAPFDQKFYILLNVAVGGNWPGSPDASTVFPVTMEVDYVRAYSGEP
jgi:beta-glucanase (GH16 family)